MVLALHKLWAPLALMRSWQLGSTFKRIAIDMIAGWRAALRSGVFVIGAHGPCPFGGALVVACLIGDTAPHLSVHMNRQYSAPGVHRLAAGRGGTRMSARVSGDQRRPAIRERRSAAQHGDGGGPREEASQL